MKKKTLMKKATEGTLSSVIRRVAGLENIDTDVLMAGVAAGEIVIAKGGGGRSSRPVGIGRGLRVKVNANIGTSRAMPSARKELEKLERAVAAGADAVMDLSTAGDLDSIRRAIISRSPVAVGTVPVYQAAVETLMRHPGRLDRMSADGIFDIIERHAADGAAFVTVHCGMTKGALERLRLQGRALGIVSRGGAFLAEWMILRDRENPLYEDFDRLLDIAARHDLILSLGDALRPGSLDDGTDRSQIEELINLGDLTRRSWEKGVQVMIEGPGHMSMDQIQANVLLEKKLCHGAPFYVLGPLVTDSAPGYDHITSAIGGALAAWAGADFLCYVTPSEHLGLPGPGDVHEGVVAARIAAHAADLARGRPDAWDRDRRMSRYRQELDWIGQERVALDPAAIAKYRSSGALSEGGVCTMCGPYCSIKGMQNLLYGKTRRRKKSGKRDQGVRRGSARKS